jgi:hypothetical protein
MLLVLVELLGWVLAKVLVLDLVVAWFLALYQALLLVLPELVS